MKVFKWSVIVLVSIVLGIAGLFALVYFSSVTTVQNKLSPTGSHRAKLVRHQGIDVNFKVVVDGETIYYSPDFAPVEFDFREQITWDKTGNVVVLEVAGKRLFAYDAKQKRQLADDELLSVEYVPFYEYRYEGKLPEEQKR
ncbi:MAG: hypothetical protein WKF34_10875 [Pyrinomonadaceae bacterium]|jgi:hypothetical protein